MSKNIKNTLSAFKALAFAGIAVFALFLSHNTANAAINITLNPGDSGPAVSELQAFLAGDASLYPSGRVTGFYGPLTQAAVARFQCRNGIVCKGTVATTGYGRVGPRTLHVFVLAMGNASFGTGGAVLDTSAPVMSPETIVLVSPTASSSPGTVPRVLMINWTTNEDARSRVIYSTTFPFNYSVAPSFADATFDTSSNVTLSGLMANTTYYYVRESVDLAGNVMWTAPKTFVTP